MKNKDFIKDYVKASRRLAREEEIEMYHNLGRTCGMECDEADWKKLLETLK